MAFLDNLLSDLIRNSTGFNAKPFVRAVGGKNILLLGGAAIAGAIAAEKMRQQQPAAGAPPLPPLPSAEPTESVPPPPPLPMAAPAEPQLPRELVFAIVRTMISSALSDGEMHAEEKKLIEGRLGESGLSPDETKQIHKDLVFPPTSEEIATMVSTTEDRELLYRFGPSSSAPREAHRRRRERGSRGWERRSVSPPSGARPWRARSSALPDQENPAVNRIGSTFPRVEDRAFSCVEMPNVLCHHRQSPFERGRREKPVEDGDLLSDPFGVSRQLAPTRCYYPVDVENAAGKPPGELLIDPDL
jgi:hypothetical protein